MRAFIGPSLGLLVGALGFLGATPRAVAAGPLPAQLEYNYGEDETTRSAAMGGGLRALGNGTTAIFLNPANLAESRVYHLEASAQITPEAGRQVYGGSIVDSVTGRLAGGLSVHGGFVNGPTNGQTHELDRSLLDVRLALAYPISDYVFVGLGGRYSKVSQIGAGGPFGPSKVSGGLVDQGDVPSRHAFVNTATFDAGLTIKASDALHIGLSGQNLTFPKNGILPTLAGGGVGYGTPDFSFELDALADFNSYSKTTARILLGGEVLVGDHVPIRAGYRYDQGASKHAASVGVGYTSPQFSIEAAVRRTISNPGATTIVIGIAYFLESSGVTRSPSEVQ